jgi:hypothetical protein
MPGLFHYLTQQSLKPVLIASRCKSLFAGIIYVKSVDNSATDSLQQLTYGFAFSQSIEVFNNAFA